MENIQKIRAKSVVKDKFWILQQDDKKVGQVKVLSNSDIEVRIHGTKAKHFTSLAEMRESGLFEFTELPKREAELTNAVQGFPTDGVAYNAVWNVQYGLPLYTQADDSRSWFAAGYYKVNVGSTWVVQFCPKLITLQRNTYEGPFDAKPGLNQFGSMFE